MGTLECSVWIEAAPEQVWAIYVDPDRIPDWQTGRPRIEDVRGTPGEPGSTYVSRRGPLHARTTVLAADAPHELVTTTDAYLGLQFEVTSRLEGRSGGTDLTLRAVTHWRRGLGPVAKLVELAVLNPREARKEFALLKALVERETSS
jgi:uncharacterized protein YndB with AHSA1/START domain